MTRDRLVGVVEHEDRVFELIDTGGIDPFEDEPIPEGVFEQARLAIESARLLLFVVDGRVGPTPLDESLLELLRSRSEDVIVVVNKLDVLDLDDQIHSFARWGIQSVVGVSAEHNRGIGVLLEEISGRIPQGPGPAASDEVRIALIGRPNMGKSSLLNQLAGEERVIVTNIPGTTTRRGRYPDPVPRTDHPRGRYSRDPAQGKDRRDGGQTVRGHGPQESHPRRRGDPSHRRNRGGDAPRRDHCRVRRRGGHPPWYSGSTSGIWLIGTPTRRPFWRRSIGASCVSSSMPPMVFLSAQTGQRVTRLLDLCLRAHEARQHRIPTADLNRFVEERIAPALRQAEGRGTSPILYMTQVGVAPPTFILFRRTRQDLHFSRKRFIINQLRDEFGFFASPIRLLEKRRRPAR